MLGMVLLYVGAVLCLNGLWLLGRIGDNEIAVIDIFVGGLTLLVSLYLAFGPGSNLANIKAAALTLLFTFTYLWVAINRYNGADGRGLGWFCLFVAITAVPVSVQTLQAAAGTLGHLVRVVLGGMGCAIILLVMEKPIGRFVGIVTVLEGILTGWLPGYLLLIGALH